MQELETGGMLSVAYPFVRDTYKSYEFDGDGFSEVEASTWRPGIRYEHQGPHPYSSPVCVADAVGRMEITIISTHKPGRFPARVFYTRQWVDPDGKRFGKTKLMMMTQSAFNSLLHGYRWPYELSAQPPMTRPAHACKAGGG